MKDENGDRRVKAKQAEKQAATLKKLAQVLGFEPSDKDTEEQIKQAKAAAQEREAERDKFQAELDRIREDNTLRKLAKENGAAPDKLVPYLRGVGDLPQWGSDEWDSKAGKLVTATLNSFPQFKAGGVAPRTSGTPAPRTTTMAESSPPMTSTACTHRASLRKSTMQWRKAVSAAKSFH